MYTEMDVQDWGEPLGDITESVNKCKQCLRNRERSVKVDKFSKNFNGSNEFIFASTVSMEFFVIKYQNKMKESFSSRRCFLNYKKFPRQFLRAIV